MHCRGLFVFSAFLFEGNIKIVAMKLQNLAPDVICRVFYQTDEGKLHFHDSKGEVKNNNNNTFK